MSAGREAGAGWRERLAPWLMALVRLIAGWLVIARPLALLAAGPPSALAAVPAPVRLAVAALLAGGLAAFVWPRSCLYGLAALLAGLAAAAWLAARAGVAAGAPLLTSAAILAVLALGEWLTRRLARGA